MDLEVGRFAAGAGHGQNIENNSTPHEGIVNLLCGEEEHFESARNDGALRQ